MRTLILGGLLASAMLVPAFAQTSPPPTAPEPAAQSTAPKAQGEMWRSSKLIGLSIYNDQNEKLGDISEILFRFLRGLRRRDMGVVRAKPSPPALSQRERENATTSLRRYSARRRSALRKVLQSKRQPF